MKRIFMILAAAVILCPFSAGSTVQGDINSDGRIDTAEAIHALRAAAGHPVGSTELGDINYDGQVDLFEVIYALQVSAGLSPQPFLTVTSATGRIWMDRNLGASRAAISSTDSAAYGDLYQWGRGTDGHQSRISQPNETLSDSDAPEHGDFIIANALPHDWRDPQNDLLWQGVSGINNPCPAGFRLPTDVELEQERTSWGTQDAAGAFASPLKLVVAGYRGFDGDFYGINSYGGYWSSTVSVANSYLLFYGSGSAFMDNWNRAVGLSVRCIKE